MIVCFYWWLSHQNLLTHAEISFEVLNSPRTLKIPQGASTL